MATSHAPSDHYYVCDACAHYWSSPGFPDACENCRSGYLREYADIDAAEDASEAIIFRDGETAADLPCYCQREDCGRCGLA